VPLITCASAERATSAPYIIDDHVLIRTPAGVTLSVADAPPPRLRPRQHLFALPVAVTERPTRLTRFEPPYGGLEIRAVFDHGERAGRILEVAMHRFGPG
jgi:hypothetical protein